MKEFFDSFNITTESAGIQPLTGYFNDFNTGKNQTGFVSPDPAEVFGPNGLGKFLELAAKYEPMIQPSYAAFPTPDKIPEDLLLTFSQFITKHNLTHIVPTIFTTSGMGLGNIDDVVMLYILQAFPAAALRAFVGQAGVFVPSSKRNRELYDKISAYLGSDVLYSSTATTTTRTKTGVEVTVMGEDGCKTVIRAKKLVVAFEPTPANNRPLGLDSKEDDVFSKIFFTSVHLGILNGTDLPNGVSFTNTPDGQVPSNYLDLPKVPFVGRFEWMGGDNIRVIVTGDETYDVPSAQALTNLALKNLASAKIIKSSRANIASWSNHGPMHARVSAKSLKAGFIQNQNALQDYRSTFWTGAAFSAQYHSLLWEYNNQYMLPKLLASI